MLRRTLRGRNALLNLFELWIGLAGVIAGIVYLYDPASVSNNAVSQVVGDVLADAWVIAYALAGVGIWYGLLRPSPKWETVGLWILGGATATNGIAIAGIFGVRGVPSASTLLALTVAAWLRAVIVQSAALELAQERDRALG